MYALIGRMFQACIVFCVRFKLCGEDYLQALKVDPSKLGHFLVWPPSPPSSPKDSDDEVVYYPEVTFICCWLMLNCPMMIGIASFLTVASILTADK